MNNVLRGTGVALITPFHHDYSVDYNSLEKLIEHNITGKVDYLVVGGTTGEAATLSDNEKYEVFKFVSNIVQNRVPLVAGIGGNVTDEIVKKVSNFEIDGYVAILSVCPYYNKPNQDGLFIHYTKIADASKLPIILYNVPGRTGVNMSTSTILKLAANSNIVGIKEASGNMDQFMEILRNKPEEFMFISGDDDLTLPLIALGASGIISVVANAFPREMSDLVRYSLNDNFSQARELHYKLLPAINMMFKEGNPCGLKTFLSTMSIISDRQVRLPLYNVSESLTKEIEALVKEW